MKGKKPEILYRGVIITEDILKSHPIYGVDLTPPNAARYDEEGRKTVGDGNEYGVYMSDNKMVATYAYARVELRHCTPLNDKIYMGERRLQVGMPSIGIIYKIHTDNLDVHIPWIKKNLQGHYNNGYSGDEWIADKVPAENYEIDQIIIGEDILHPKKEIKFNNHEEILPKIEAELNERRIRLENLEKYIETIPKKKLQLMDNDELNVYREIYRKGGLTDINPDIFVVTDGEDCLQVMMAKIYKSNPDNMPLKELLYLNNLYTREKISLSDLGNKLLNDLEQVTETKRLRIENAKLANKECSTQVFDKNIEMLSSLLNMYKEIIQKKLDIENGKFLNEEDGIISHR